MSRLCVAAVAAFCWVVVALGQDPKKPEKPPARPSDSTPRPMLTPENIVANILQRMDANRDGKISKSEAQNRVADNFTALDANKDGFIDKSELQTMARRMAMLPPGGPNGPRPGGPAGFGSRPDPLDFDALDKNADGRLTAEELKGSRFFDQFAAIDKNRDGKLDPREWEAYHNVKK